MKGVLPMSEGVPPTGAEHAHSSPVVIAPSTENICAVVVAYFPDEGFEGRLQTILPQVARLLVVDNTPEAISLSPKLIAAWGERLRCIANHANRGVAAALNQGLEYALRQGCPWVLTFDQDTQCHSNMVAVLGSIYNDCNPKPAVIGSNYFDPRNNKPKVPAEGDKCLEQKTVITSGSLVNAKMARMIGNFREDYFIDQVDHEFCLRLRTQGCRVVISREPLMTHSVGFPGGADLPFLGVLPNHPPLRKYYTARNTVVTVSAFWRQEPDWCLRRLIRLILGLGYTAVLEENRLAKVSAFFAGIADGVFRRLGPCRRRWLLKAD
jgi:rhamnosyltransferase